MKKLKKLTLYKDKSNLKIGLFKPEIKCSRLTVDSRICNIDKFNEFFQIIDSTKEFKNIVSNDCFDNLTFLVTNYSDFLKRYNLLTSSYLNSWERQTIFSEISGHYFETAIRHLSKSQYIIQKQSGLKNNQIQKAKTKLNSIVQFIDKNSNLIKVVEHKDKDKDKDKDIYKNYNTYQIDFDVKIKLASLNNYLDNYKKELEFSKGKEIDRLEKLITSYKKIIKSYEKIENLSLNKPIIYQRIINLITTKKLRLLKKVKLAEYQTGTHSRHLDNAQISIVKDLENGKYKYFLKVRKLNKLSSREPRFKETKITKEFVENLKAKNNLEYQLKLAKYNEDNFIYLPLIFNHSKLNKIGKTIDNILTKNNPQILLKSEQLRIDQSRRKVHLIFNYEEENKLGNIIESNHFVIPDENNTIGLDVNLKHNLLADSNGIFYDDILKNNLSELNKNKNKFIENLNEIVLLQSIEKTKRTEKQTYRYEKLLRSNESLIKTYLSGLIKNWKSKDILHIVLEDLNMVRDKSYYEHDGVKIKYTRLSRLLRLSQIKIWIEKMAEKQGLFTHLVNPAYTSQECSKCHHISPSNRLNQESFKCTHCNHEINADINSAINIKNRILHKELKNKLSKDNVYLCSKPKPIYYRVVKSIIEEVYNYGVVTELLPKQAINRLYKKEAPSFRAG